METSVTLSVEEFDRLRNFAQKWQQHLLPVAIVTTTTKFSSHKQELYLYQTSELTDVLTTKILDLNEEIKRLTIISNGRHAEIEKAKRELEKPISFISYLKGNYRKVGRDIKTWKEEILGTGYKLIKE